MNKQLQQELEAFIEGCNLNTATGSYLDNYVQIYTGLLRDTYGNDYDNCPNDYCYWNGWDDCWEESDSHYRERLYKVLEG